MSLIMTKYIRPVLNPILDFIYPPSCPICQVEMEAYAPVCTNCQSLIQNKIKIKHHRPQDFQHLETPFYFDDVITFWDYFSEVEKMIHLVKYEGRKKLGEFVGQMVSENGDNMFSDIADLIIPVPLHSQRHRERGYNQSELYAKAISKIIFIPTNRRLLKRIRNTQTQTQLSAEARQTNVQDAFIVKQPALIQDKAILLIDDVITSGATINSCAKACKEAGAKAVIGLGMARPNSYWPEISP